ncbi:hypothetical protein HK101_011734, partial [Irineochytrium annulatum]
MSKKGAPVQTGGGGGYDRNYRGPPSPNYNNGGYQKDPRYDSVDNYDGTYNRQNNAPGKGNGGQQDQGNYYDDEYDYYDDYADDYGRDDRPYDAPPPPRGAPQGVVSPVSPNRPAGGADENYGGPPPRTLSRKNPTVERVPTPGPARKTSRNAPNSAAPLTPRKDDAGRGDYFAGDYADSYAGDDPRYDDDGLYEDDGGYPAYDGPPPRSLSAKRPQQQGGGKQGRPVTEDFDDDYYADTIGRSPPSAAPAFSGPPNMARNISQDRAPPPQQQQMQMPRSAGMPSPIVAGLMSPGGQSASSSPGRKPGNGDGYFDDAPPQRPMPPQGQQ